MNALSRNDVANGFQPGNRGACLARGRLRLVQGQERLRKPPRPAMLSNRSHIYERPWPASPSKIASRRSPTASASCCWRPIARARSRPARRCMIDRDNDKNPVVALREIAEDVVDPEELREALIATLQRVDERSEAEEEAETLALLADPHAHAHERAGTGPRPAERPRRRPGGALLSLEGVRPALPIAAAAPAAVDLPRGPTAKAEGRAAEAAAAQVPAPVRADRAGQGLRPHRRRGAAEPRLRLRHAHARGAEARLGRPLFRPPDRGGGHPHRLPAGHRRPSSPPCCTT